MKFQSFFQIPASVGLLIAISPLFAIAATPAVTNVHGEQRPDTHLVDVYYDLADADSASVSVRLQVSANGGDNWTVVPVVSVSQAVGANVTPGHGKHILWNAGADWGGQVSKTVLFKVIASDTTPAPDGFALIPAGRFQMGDQSSLLVGSSSERLLPKLHSYPPPPYYAVPVQTVQVSACYIAKYLVTKSDWDAVRAWGLTHGYTDLIVGAGKGTNHPVQAINWADMMKWCNARSEMEGLAACYTVSAAIYRTGLSVPDCNWSANGYRLPTEAEWEKAARVGLMGQNFPWGNTISHANANFRNDGGESDQTGSTGYDPIWGTGDYPFTSPVGLFAPNGYGLYDMAGNVMECCWDYYGDYTAGSQTDPRGPSTGSFPVLRGGAWYNYADGCSVAARSLENPAYGPSNLGFRIARSSVP